VLVFIKIARQCLEFLANRATRQHVCWRVTGDFLVSGVGRDIGEGVSCSWFREFRLFTFIERSECNQWCALFESCAMSASGNTQVNLATNLGECFSWDLIFCDNWDIDVATI
jgi:hypothetical protein